MVTNKLMSLLKVVLKFFFRDWDDAKVLRFDINYFLFHTFKWFNCFLLRLFSCVYSLLMKSILIKRKDGSLGAKRLIILLCHKLGVGVIYIIPFCLGLPL